jgi:hypothetical protein
LGAAHVRLFRLLGFFKIRSTSSQIERHIAGLFFVVAIQGKSSVINDNDYFRATGARHVHPGAGVTFRERLTVFVSASFDA